MIEVREVTKRFGSFKALDELSLHVEEASVYGLLGPNGAGKTTLIKHLAGIYRQDSGQVTIDGEPVYENPRVKSSLVYIPDDLYFFSQYSIDEMAKFYAGIYPAWNWDRFHLLKQVFPLESKGRITHLSKGMQKQVAFWLGICMMPRVMILDEPVDGLDPVMRKKVWNLVLQDVAEHRTTVLVSSHNLRELEDVCDHVGILHQGKIVVERELDSMKSDIHKIQVAYAGTFPEGLFQEGETLYRTQNGSVFLLIVKGNREELLSRIRTTNPIILDVLPLSLEEIFIYELGGMGYEIKNILI
ncbi:ABC transporter ATP-binding protein [Candidatus Formimonas warabiya]|uniref:ABC transporter n=1 Tax=Formimonas warabiya TaxID=1761012 RepID=A0A3G1KXZ3_FORW1|nr:ABC transporter ATP-binding protein [Candidatus Formimonas warabiya]ATW27311.1 ABC transporter [Candidatus Formimonas warabiya]